MQNQNSSCLSKIKNEPDNICDVFSAFIYYFLPRKYLIERSHTYAMAPHK